MKNIIMKCSRAIACLALMVTVANVNSACFFIIHQPKLPSSAKDLRKF